ncbi:hypothetical protein IV454_18870 [Massilia antarctica]|uniref:Uncharacterized protein n=1 Tax=Massilia antarctica TaxID=2765360 RepID=A0AA48W6R0_9BURK|nr:hypothetical protein [Massilia antarctica]QPI47648.1 hypothetical protein IV454_18870 [Massilia antarctica]
MTYLNNRAQQLSAPAGPNQAEWPAAPAGDADLIRWAAAQGQALSKLQIFSTMAKQVNEQQ